MMIDTEFQKLALSLRDLPFREDFEVALYDLYRSANPVQRAELRTAYHADSLGGSKIWRNPADYFRTDLNREQRMRQILLAMSLKEETDDYREDLLSIAYCYHNLAMLGVDADAVLEEIAEISGPRFGSLILGFARRSTAEKSPKLFGLKTEQSPHGSVVDFRL